MGIRYSNIRISYRTIANSLGIWNSTIGEAIDEVKNLEPLLKTQKDRIIEIEVASKNVNITYEDRVRIAKTEISVLGEVRDSLTKIEIAAKKIGETNWFQAMFTKNSNLEEISESLKKQEQILNKLGLVNKTYNVTGIIKASEVEELKTITRVIGTKDIEYKFKMIGLKDAKKQIETLWDTLSLAQKQLNPEFVPNMLAAYSKSLSAVAKDAQLEKEKIVASFNSIQQASISLNDANK